jgi:hypothetical protein
MQTSKKEEVTYGIRSCQEIIAQNHNINILKEPSAPSHSHLASALKIYSETQSYREHKPLCRAENGLYTDSMGRRDQVIYIIHKTGDMHRSRESAMPLAIPSPNINPKSMHAMQTLIRTPCIIRRRHSDTYTVEYNLSLFQCHILKHAYVKSTLFPLPSFLSSSIRALSALLLRRLLSALESTALGPLP